MKHVAFILVLALGSGVSAGCFQFHDDYPDDLCESDRDCFVSQGEACNEDTKVCEVVSTSAQATGPETSHDDGYQAAGQLESMSLDSSDAQKLEVSDAE